MSSDHVSKHCGQRSLFRRLSRIAAVMLILLIASPVTAPFATVDLAPETSPIQETFDTSGKISVAAPTLAPFILRVELASTDHLIHAIFVIPEDDRAPLTSVLRL